MKFVKVPGKDFEMADAPVTQKEWFAVMKTKPSYFKNKPNNPVEQVSWDDCQEFIKKLNAKTKKHTYRLPTEEEWEFCAKPCGGQKIDETAWHLHNSKGSTHPVRSKKPNEYGLYDMIGNVWEWTETQTDSYRVIRGGSWGNDARYLRSGFRGYYSPGDRSNLLGFRLVRTPNALRSNPLTLGPSKAERALAIARQALKDIEEVLE